MEISKYCKKKSINAIYNIRKEELVFHENEHILSVEKTYESINIKNYIFKETDCSEKKMMDSLKLVHLNEDVLNKKMSVLSSTEVLKIELAILLIKNVNFIVLDSFDKYFMEKELFFFKKLFKKLVKNYNKTFVFLNGNLSFFFEFADRIVVRKSKKNFIVFNNPTFYEKELLNLVGTPKIIEFVNYLRENGKKIMFYTDLKELLKAIFREV